LLSTALRVQICKRCVVQYRRGTAPQLSRNVSAQAGAKQQHCYAAWAKQQHCTTGYNLLFSTKLYGGPKGKY
jgi:hypothetical protein